MIKEYGEGKEELKGMGTTILSQVFRPPHLHISNVGDSRLYLISNRELFQLTSDNSMVQEKLNMGLYDREQAAQDKRKNVLVRAVGIQDTVEVDIYSYKFHPGDIFVGCSDGLYNSVSGPDLLYIINDAVSDPKEASQEQVDLLVRKLIDQANANGGDDNISVIVSIVK